jgi:hypothetical protein
MRPSTFQKMFAAELAVLERAPLLSRGARTLVAVVKWGFLALLLSGAIVSAGVGFAHGG